MVFSNTIRVFSEKNVSLFKVFFESKKSGFESLCLRCPPVECVDSLTDKPKKFELDIWGYFLFLFII